MNVLMKMNDALNAIGLHTNVMKSRERNYYATLRANAAEAIRTYITESGQPIGEQAVVSLAATSGKEHYRRDMGFAATDILRDFYTQWSIKDASALLETQAALAIEQLRAGQIDETYKTTLGCAALANLRKETISDSVVRSFQSLIHTDIQLGCPKTSPRQSRLFADAACLQAVLLKDPNLAEESLDPLFYLGRDFAREANACTCPKRAEAATSRAVLTLKAIELIIPYHEKPKTVNEIVSQGCGERFYPKGLFLQKSDTPEVVVPRTSIEKIMDHSFMANPVAQAASFALVKELYRNDLIAIGNSYRRTPTPSV